MEQLCGKQRAMTYGPGRAPPGTISVIAPVALKESEDTTRNWRKSVNALSRQRLRIMLRSFLGNVPTGLLAEFLIVCPDAETGILRDEVDRLVQGYPRALRRCVRVQGETDMLAACGLDPDMGRFPGWELQQIIKLAYGRLCPTGYYLTMDSDNVTLRPLSAATFFAPDGRGKQTMETRERYEKLYTAEFAEREYKLKTRRFEVSRVLLDLGRYPKAPHTIPSETPTLLCAEVSRALLARLESRHGSSLAEALRNRRGWTEYTLYYGYLALTRERRKYHVFRTRDVLLSLDASAWHKSANYLNPDRRFTRRRLRRATAPFVAIQSWHTAEELLKGRKGTLEDFYRDLESWFAPPPPTFLERLRDRLRRIFGPGARRGKARARRRARG